MLRHSFATLSILIALSAERTVAQPPAAPPPRRELAQLQDALSAAMKKQPRDYTAYSELAEQSRSRVQELIARDELRTASDFLAASIVATEPSGFFESRRVEHELALVALVLGHPEAVRRVALTWDGLNWSMGRGQRLGSFQRDGVPTNMDRVPAPNVIRELFKDVAAARARAAGKPNDPELQRMRDEDQGDREGTLDAERLNRMRMNDSVHLALTLQLLADGAPVTGRDMHNAATVLQHGGTPATHLLANELTMAAIALGDTSAVWLVARSYDRMLLGMGHRQRFNTQYGGTGMNQLKLLPLDTTAVNDRIRVTLGSRRLAESAKPPGAP
jgi:hypothetical protein